jgi:ABC-type bacteriocin/lantibiotic exporter with double-glycine peptidase domain
LGEKGVKISGGERQRIGIARALYHKPKLLILDESTNSLDFDTEQLIIKEILNLDYKVTIVMITHRLNTIENFDTIFFIDSGKLQQISFQELSKNNELLKN